MRPLVAAGAPRRSRREQARGRLGRVMTGHDDEAPRAADLLRAWNRRAAARRAGTYPSWSRPLSPPWGGKRLGGRLLGGHKQENTPSPEEAIPVPAPALPASYAHQAPWVPAKPAGIDGRSRLVPQNTPVRRCSAPTAAATWPSSRPGGRCRGGGRWPADSPASPTSSSANRAARNQPIACTLVGGRRPIPHRSCLPRRCEDLGLGHRRAQRVRLLRLSSGHRQ